MLSRHRPPCPEPDPDAPDAPNVGLLALSALERRCGDEDLPFVGVGGTPLCP